MLRVRLAALGHPKGQLVDVLQGHTVQHVRLGLSVGLALNVFGSRTGFLHPLLSELRRGSVQHRRRFQRIYVCH